MSPPNVLFDGRSVWTDLPSQDVPPWGWYLSAALRSERILVACYTGGLIIPGSSSSSYSQQRMGGEGWPWYFARERTVARHCQIVSDNGSTRSVRDRCCSSTWFTCSLNRSSVKKSRWLRRSHSPNSVDYILPNRFVEEDISRGRQFCLLSCPLTE